MGQSQVPLTFWVVLRNLFQCRRRGRLLGHEVVIGETHELSDWFGMDGNLILKFGWIFCLGGGGVVDFTGLYFGNYIRSKVMLMRIAFDGVSLCAWLSRLWIRKFDWICGRATFCIWQVFLLIFVVRIKTWWANILLIFKGRIVRLIFGISQRGLLVFLGTQGPLGQNCFMLNAEDPLHLFLWLRVLQVPEFILIKVEKLAFHKVNLYFYCLLCVLHASLCLTQVNPLLGNLLNCVEGLLDFRLLLDLWKVDQHPVALQSEQALIVTCSAFVQLPGHHYLAF